VAKVARRRPLEFRSWHLSTAAWRGYISGRQADNFENTKLYYISATYANESRFFGGERQVADPIMKKAREEKTQWKCSRGGESLIRTWLVGRI